MRSARPPFPPAVRFDAAISCAATLCAAATLAHAQADARPAPVHNADGSTGLDARSWMREFIRVSTAADGRSGVR